MKKLFYLSSLPALLISASAADLFVNGSFEAGTGSSANGWTLDSGIWFGANSITSTGGFNSDSEIITNNAAKDYNTGNNLYQVYSGAQSFRLGDENGGSHWSSAYQSFANYNDTHMYFAFAAVLNNPGHSPSQNPRFVFQVKDETTNTFLYNVSVTADAGSNNVQWLSGIGDWKYTNWNALDIDTSAVLGHTLSVFVASYDCTLGGHGGYAYIDGFSSLAAETPNTGVTSQAYGSVVPEPSTYGLVGIGALALAVAARRRKKA